MILFFGWFGSRGLGFMAALYPVADPNYRGVHVPTLQTSMTQEISRDLPWGFASYVACSEFRR